jgi:hypothetical protein
MTAPTRRGLLICLVLGLITLPVELLLVPVARVPGAAQAASAWAADQRADDLRAASQQIDAYPTVYRRAIMSALTPADRSGAWRAHFRRFLAAHPELTAAQRAVVEDAIAIATPDALGRADAETRTRISALFNQARDVFGNDTANALFVTLGTEQSVRADILPLRQRLADRVRSWRVANASSPDCNCNSDVDTCTVWPESDWLECSERYACEFDTTWPMCGPFWSWACNGWCRVVTWPGGENNLN